MTRQKGKAEPISANFTEPMLCLAVEKLPEGSAWQYEVKLDGYRAIGVPTKTGVEIMVMSCRSQVWSDAWCDWSPGGRWTCRAMKMPITLNTAQATRRRSA